jgi:hypothetical protein
MRLPLLFIVMKLSRAYFARLEKNFWLSINADIPQNGPSQKNLIAQLFLLISKRRLQPINHGNERI